MFPNPLSPLKILALSLVAVASVGCAATKPLEVRTLPYHIAIAPMPYQPFGGVFGSGAVRFGGSPVTGCIAPGVRG